MVRLIAAAKQLHDYAKMLRAVPVHATSITQLAEDVDDLADSLSRMANKQTTAGWIAADFGKARE